MKSALFLILCIAAISYAEEYTCGDDPAIVHFYNNDLKCPDGLICNSKGKTVGTAKPKPCVTPKEICIYSCSGTVKSDVIIDGVTFSCPKNQECNSKITSCSVCVDKECDKTAYTCDPKNTNQIILGGSPFPCPINHVCNKDYASPCNPCIPAVGASVSKTSRSLAHSFLLKSYYA